MEALYPVRLPEINEDQEAYREYCGAARLVQVLKSIANRPEQFDPDSDELLEEEAVGRAIAAANGTIYQE